MELELAGNRLKKLEKDKNQASSRSPLLELSSITRYFGGLGAVIDLDMVVYPGEILALIGPNGAGKTTTFNLCTGFLRPSKGRLFFQGQDVTNLKPHVRARMGLVRSFQSNILFMDKTVTENVMLGFHTKYHSGFLQEIIYSRKFRKERDVIENNARKILDIFNLTALKNELAKNLPHGFQRTLGVAVALATEPSLLLLDEPVTGMNDEETATMMRFIRHIRDKGVTILLVEHDMKAVMENCERIVVMDHGIKIAEGSPRVIANNEQVIEAYLGTGGVNARNN